MKRDILETVNIVLLMPIMCVVVVSMCAYVYYDQLDNPTDKQ